MFEDLTSSGLSKILDVGVIGAVCVLLIITLIVRERWWQTREEKLSSTYAAELKDERGRHDKTKDALLEEVRSNERALSLVQTQMQNWQSAVDAMLKLVRREA